MIPVKVFMANVFIHNFLLISIVFMNIKNKDIKINLKYS